MRARRRHRQAPHVHTERRSKRPVDTHLALVVVNCVLCALKAPQSKPNATWKLVKTISQRPNSVAECFAASEWLIPDKSSLPSKSPAAKLTLEIDEIAIKLEDQGRRNAVNAVEELAMEVARYIHDRDPPDTSQCDQCGAPMYAATRFRGHCKMQVAGRLALHLAIGARDRNELRPSRYLDDM